MERIREIGIVPVVRATSADEAFAAVEAIRAGGIPILEITLTVPGAVQIIAELVAPHRRRRADRRRNGARRRSRAARASTPARASSSAPRSTSRPIELCRRLGVPVFAGALTPTEIVTAWKAGANAVKVFPANAVGGATYLKSVKAPLPQIELLPTGGVSLKTAADFIAAGAFALGVGADLVDLGACAGARPPRSRRKRGNTWPPSLPRARA